MHQIRKGEITSLHAPGFSNNFAFLANRGLWQTVERFRLAPCDSFRKMLRKSDATEQTCSDIIRTERRDDSHRFTLRVGCHIVTFTREQSIVILHP